MTIKIGKNVEMPDNNIRLKNLNAGAGASLVDGALAVTTAVASTSVTSPAGYFDNIPGGGGGGGVNASAIIAALGYVPLSNTDTIANSVLFNGHDESYFANASLLTSGNISSTLLGTGTANSTTYLRGDKTWGSLPVSNTSQAGIVQLIDSVSNTSIDIAATANSVRTAYNAAIAAGNAAAAYANAIAYSGNATAAYANAIAYSGNAVQAYTNAIAYSGNAALAYANAIAYSGNAALAYANAIAWSGNAVAAYTNAIAWSGNAVAAYTNAVSYAATIAATAYSNAIAYSGNAVAAYTNAIAWSGNAALAYSNAVSSAAGLYMPLAGGVFTGNVTPNSNTLNLGSTTARWNFWANSITSGPILSGSLYVNNNIYTTANTTAYTISSDPLATIGSGGYVQLWGSGSANPGLVIIGNANRSITQNATVTSIAGTGTLYAAPRAIFSGDSHRSSPTLGSAHGSLQVSQSGDQSYGMIMGVNGATGDSWIQVQRVDGTGTAYDLQLQPSGGVVQIGVPAGGSSIPLRFTGANTTEQTLGLITDGNWRWRVGGSGGSAKNFDFYRYNDSGTFQDTTLSLSRATGLATFANGIFMTAGASYFNELNIMAGNPLRWRAASGAANWMYVDNNGTNFVLSRQSKTGSYIDSPMYITLNNGDVQFGNNVNITGDFTARYLSSTGGVYQNIGTAVQTIWYETDGGSNNKRWNHYVDGGVYYFVISNDDTSGSKTCMQFQRSANVATFVGFGANTLALVDNAYTLGGGSNRWTTVYATTGSINTSDETLKTPFESISPELKTAAIKIIKEIGSYKWLDAVEAKGEEEARIHIGLTSQKVQSLLAEAGVDPDKYAMFCRDELVDPVTETDFSDPDNPVQIKKKKPRKKKYRYGLRYDQVILLALAAIAEKLEL